MKIEPISADLLLKLALIAGGLGLAWYAIKQARQAATDTLKGAGQAVGAVADAAAVGFNPTNGQNYINRAVSSVGAAATGSSNFSLGSWLYDLTHKDPFMDTPPSVTPDSYYNMYP